MSFLIKDDKVQENYEQIWDVIKNKLSIKFHSKPIYNQKYLKAKTIAQVLVMVLKSFLMKNLIKNLKNGALSRKLIKSIKKYFIKNFIKNPKSSTLPRNLIKIIKKYFIKNLIKNLKKCLIMSKKDTL